MSMDKLVYLTFTLIGSAIVLASNVSQPRTIVLICALSALGGISRYASDILTGTEFSFLHCGANVVASLFFGWLTAAIAEYAIFRDSETLLSGLTAAAALGGLFGRDFVKIAPIIVAKWGAKKADVHLTDDDLKVLREVAKKNKK